MDAEKEYHVPQPIASALPSGIRDNFRRGSVGDFLKEKIQPGSKLSIVSAYFTIYAFEALKDHLLEIDSLNFLFGEPRFVRSLDPDKTDKKAFKIEDEGLKLANRHLQKRVAKECADWITQKVQIKSVKQANLLHGKMYYIDNHGIPEAILGSSNFTVSGLGLSDNSRNNIELNLVVDSKRDQTDLKAWFGELWHNEELVEDVKEEVLRYLEQLYQNHAPEFIYFKTLFHIFEKYLAEQEQSGLLSIQSQVVDTDIWKALFEFQKDGVKAAINKILTHNGCIIADSVGLGKTYEALAIIKYFELRNHKVLVLCPKKLRENWTVYLAHVANALNPFVNDRFSYTVLSHTDLSRDGGKSGDIDLFTVNWGNFDLVVIDESHNFRNNTRGRWNEAGEVLRKSRYERLMEDIIKSGVKTKVLLLSATPVNNDLRDLRNQIYFLTEGQDNAFQESMGIANLQYMLADAQRAFADWSKTSQTRDVKDLLDSLSSSFFKLLDELTIARSRKHIQRYYQDSVAELGGFPERLKPISVYPEVDLKRRFMAYERLNQEISQYKLSLFNPSAYVKPEYGEQYQVGRVVQNFTQRDREHFLIGMMKVNFLKRLESSVHSFAITLDRTITKIEQLQDQIERFERLRAGQSELDPDILSVDALDDEDLEAVMQVGVKFKYNLAHLDLVAWLADLEKDRQQLISIYSSAHLVTPEHDAKLAKLKELITQKVRKPSTSKHGQLNRKVLVFTAFADTAVYLFNNLQDWARQELKIHLALVTGGSVENKTSLGRNEFGHILTNFSPIAKRRAMIPGMPQNEEIDLLIATDCISEGQNLQDCDYLIDQL
jgi:hypothetical protein